MTTQHIQLNELDVIGYGDVLPEGKGPAVLPPVFRHRTEIDRCYVPPFRITGNWLVETQCVSFTELQDLEGDESITLPKDFKHPAKPDHQLWVDEAGAVRYEPAGNAKRNQQLIHQRHLDAAISTLREGKFEDARRHAGVALAANDRALEPRALIAAFHALRGETAQAAFMRKSAEQAGLNGDSFTLLMKSYAEMIPATTWESLSFEAANAASEKVGVELYRRFELPSGLVPFVGPVLRNALFRQNKNSTEIQCGGSDAKFLAEFLRLFKHNFLSTMVAGMAVEIVCSAYWEKKVKVSRISTPWPRSVEDYFFRLKGVLIDTGVLGFVGKEY